MYGGMFMSCRVLLVLVYFCQSKYKIFKCGYLFVQLLEKYVEGYIVDW